MKLKAVIPGGSSVPLLPASEVDTPLDFESMNEKEYVPRLRRRDRDR